MLNYIEVIKIPFGEYKNFKDCVSKNQDKDDPDAYCAEIKRMVEKSVDWSYDMTFEKIGDKGGHMYLAGYASNGDEDEDGQNMDMASLRDSYDKYMKNPIVKFLHDSTPQWKGAIGKVIEKHTDSDGQVWETKFGAKPFLVVKLSKSPKLDWLRGMIDEGLFNGFSIGGKAKSISDGGTIIVKSWLETSIVDVPSAKGSFFQVLKAACTDGNCPAIEKNIEKQSNPRVLKFIRSVDKLQIGRFDEAMDTFLKGGPGSGKKGHTTVIPLSNNYQKMDMKEVKNKLLKHYQSGEILNIEARYGENALRARLQQAETGGIVRFTKAVDDYITFMTARAV